MTLLSPYISIPSHKIGLLQFVSEHFLPDGKVEKLGLTTGGRRLAITGGMYGAGTTWTLNVLRNLALSRDQDVFTTYCENLGPTQIARLSHYDAMIVKGHVLGGASAELVRSGNAKLFLPIRDPRDAICSLMGRFNYSFSSALRAVTASAENILRTQMKLPNLILRYEDGFCADVGSVRKICDYFGWPVTSEEAQSLLDALKPEKVQSLIHRLEQEQAINPRWARHSVDPQTNWHPNHVGDQRVGKYRDMLSPMQIDRANSCLGRFMQQFDY